MTYTVKNGTWCKDNNKEYYSTTKTGLKAALAAGEITAGTKVVIHEPQYHAGQLIQSLNPECPEGCFVPHGQTFDTSIYEELAKIFTGGILPDMRECVMVCAGRSERPEITNHDEYTAGQFKDDQFAEHKHSATSTVTDPGHSHGVTDPGHVHGVSDPGHVHNIGVPVTPADRDTGVGPTVSGINTSGAGKVSLNTVFATTNISVNSHGTDVTVNSHGTDVTVDTTVANEGAADKVTHGKQFGVYYYIAF